MSGPSEQYSKSCVSNSRSRIKSIGIVAIAFIAGARAFIARAIADASVVAIAISGVISVFRHLPNDGANELRSADDKKPRHTVALGLLLVRLRFVP